jgi:hypothetical protein
MAAAPRAGGASRRGRINCNVAGALTCVCIRAWSRREQHVRRD